MSKCEPKKKESARADNRALFPETARIVDEFKAVFGEDQVKLLYAEEGGRTIGTKPPEPTNFITAERWLWQSEHLIKPELERRKVTKMPPSLYGYVKRGR